jgi:Undecaprenyl-phosphate glucose phosphotransferase
MDGHVGDVMSFQRAKRLFHPDFVSIVGDLLVVWDVLTVIGSAYACAFICKAFAPHALPSDFVLIVGRVALLGAVLAVLTLRNPKLSSGFEIGSGAELIGPTCLRVCVLIGLMLTIGFLTKTSDTVPRLWAVCWFLSVFPCIFAGRVLLLYHLRVLEARGTLRERIAIVGHGPVADRLIERLRERGRNVEIVGVFDDFGESPAGGGHRSNRDIASLVELGKQHAIDRVILALPATPEHRLQEIARQVKALDVEVALCPTTIGLSRSPVHVRFMADIPLTVLARRPIRRWGIVLKAIEDRVLGALLLIGLAPVLALIALFVRIDSPGPIIFRQWRHGCNNTEFQVWKFRTMTWAGEAAGAGLLQTRRNDPRVTRVGRILRKMSLDELPQLFNVLRGEMSLVGPRPHMVVMRTEDRMGEEIIAEYAHRHRVKPGITGWAQIKGYRGATHTVDQVRKRVEHDIYYIENWSFLFDLKIIILTPFKLIFDRSNAY